VPQVAAARRSNGVVRPILSLFTGGVMVAALYVFSDGIKGQILVPGLGYIPLNRSSMAVFCYCNPYSFTALNPKHPLSVPGETSIPGRKIAFRAERGELVILDAKAFFPCYAYWSA